jgi:hypothetical protein
MNSQPGKLSVLPGRVGTGGVTPIVYAEPLLLHRRPQDICSFRTLSPPLSAAMQRPGSIRRNDFTPFCRTVCSAESKEARLG